MQPWKTRERRILVSQPPFLVVEQHAVELPDGRVIPDWPWIITPDYVNIVAVTADLSFVCFRQTKYGIAGTSLATVGGYLEPGEDPLLGAQRELREETGYAARSWASLGSYCVDGNRGAGTAHLFLALQAHPVTAIDADDLEEQELVLLSRAEVEAALAAGEFKVLGWAAAIALALVRLPAGQPTGKQQA